MNPELVMHLRALTRFIYYVTEEEDVFLKGLHEGVLSPHADRTQVFNAAFGLVPLPQLIRDWSSKAHQAGDASAQQINNALINIYKADPRDEQNFYIITDPERWLTDPHIQRRFLNIAHQVHQDIRNIKITIFVGPRLVIPQKLQRYIEVVHDTGLSDKDLQKKIEANCEHLHIGAPSNVLRHFRGLTDYEIDAACAQSIVRTRKDKKNPKRLDPQIIGEFKRRQLNKTSLLQYIDTAAEGFDNVGGVDRFKAWANKTKATWTDEGQKFGLRPPKGVLAVGVWGCGKSISVKALGQCWRLPVVQLEMGKLRSSGVGETESNVYRATRLIESVSPCIVWVDEAEKSMSGGQSSSQSDAGTTSRAIGILSTWLQETKAQVCLAMTANALDTLPIEFVNRMDERFFFNLPSVDERIEIIKIHLRKWGQDPTVYNLADLADKAVNMVGREIEQAIGAAMTESFEQGEAQLSEDILLVELGNKPRIFQTMAKELQDIMDWVGYDPEKKEGIRARMASTLDSEGGGGVFNILPKAEGDG